MVICRAGIVALVAGALGFAGCGGSTNEESFVDEDGPGGPTSLVSVVAESEAIVIGTLMGEREAVIELSSPSTGEVAGRRVELVREFRVSGLIRGGLAVGETVQVRATVELETWGAGADDVRTSSFEVVELEAGLDYVLFLNAATDGVGVRGVVPQGPMAIALVEGDQLTFVATDEYRDDVAAAGLYELGKTGLGASFDVTLAELRDVVLRAPYRPTSNEPDPTEVARISMILAQTNIVETVLSEVDRGALTNSDGIEARFRELGFDPSVLGDCPGAERRFADRGFPVELGCP